MIHLTISQEGDKRVLTISQKKFCADGKFAGNMQSVDIGSITVMEYSIHFLPIGFESMIWQVPITIATKTNPSAVKFVLSKTSATVTVEGVRPDDWILVYD